MAIASRTLSTLLLLAATLTAQAGDPSIRLDAFGYTPWARKVVVLREPVVGFDAGTGGAPGAVLEVRRASDDALVLTAPVVPWNGGALHLTSGDRAWWADISALEAEGEYVARDPLTGHVSEDFRVAPDVYDDALAAAVRMFYFQRCGVPHDVAHATASWAALPCHVGPQQDTAATSADDPGGQPLLDLSGGWHDAGEYGKYVNSTDDAIHDLLGAYAAAPELFGDALGLPESGNGVPDLLDEVRHGLEWMLRMQRPDGSVLHKVGVADFGNASPPSSDLGQRYYGHATASATISAAGAFAHGARVFAGLGVPDATTFAGVLEAAAVAAWDWLEANPGAIPSTYANVGFFSASAEDDADWQLTNRLRAAAHLFALTGDGAYRDWFDANHAAAHLVLWGFASVFEQGLHDGLLAYASLPGATPAVADAIRGAYAGSVGGAFQLGPVLAEEDPYRAWLADVDHGWGSNRTKAAHGRLFAAMVSAGLDPLHVVDYEQAAAGYVNSLHGTNPLGLTYLTAMHDLGAPASVNETWHAWFADGTVWDSASTSLIGPPPGYLTGGPNPFYAPDPVFGGVLAPPQNQPILKSYLDWNTSWPQNAWEVTECQLTYQAVYVALLAGVARRPAWDDLGGGVGGPSGAPRLRPSGPFTPGSAGAVTLDGAPPVALAGIFLGTGSTATPFKGGILWPSPLIGPFLTTTDAGGEVLLPFIVPPTAPLGATLVCQWVLVDGTAPAGLALSNALAGQVRP